MDSHFALWSTAFALKYFFEVPWLFVLMVIFPADFSHALVLEPTNKRASISGERLRKLFSSWFSKWAILLFSAMKTYTWQWGTPTHTVVLAVGGIYLRVLHLRAHIEGIMLCPWFLYFYLIWRIGTLIIILRSCVIQFCLQPFSMRIVVLAELMNGCNTIIWLVRVL